jgi:hypothetical protein
MIHDDGEGIFKKLRRELDLADARHAVLELSKGKVTTDPAHHTGEGIFFTSRMFDSFFIHAGNIWFVHHPDKDEDDPACLRGRGRDPPGPGVDALSDEET